MDESYWVPTYPNTGLNAIGAMPSSVIVAPTPPDVGAKMLLTISAYGPVIVSEGQSLPIGSAVIEVEVTAVKKAKITLE